MTGFDFAEPNSKHVRYMLSLTQESTHQPCVRLLSSDRASFLRPSITSTDTDVAATTKNRGRSGRLGDADDIDERKGGDLVWHKARRSLLKTRQHVLTRPKRS